LWLVAAKWLWPAAQNNANGVPFAKIATEIRNKEMQSNGEYIIYTAA